jgi:hypothetical protein
MESYSHYPEHRAAPVAIPAADPARDPLIEDYLDHLCAPLVGLVPYARRQELRAEWAAHLDCLVEAHREMGHGPAGAVLGALQQFGDPDRMAQQVVRELTPPRPPRAGMVRGTAIALGCFGAASCFSTGLIAVMSPLFQPVRPAIPAVEALWYFLLIPFFTGMLSGALAGWMPRGRNALCALYALTLILVTTVGIPVWTGWPIADNALEFMAAQSLLWTPIGTGGAAFGGWLRGTLKRSTSRRWALG